MINRDSNVMILPRRDQLLKEQSADLIHSAERPVKAGLGRCGQHGAGVRHPNETDASSITDRSERLDDQREAKLVRDPADLIHRSHDGAARRRDATLRQPRL
jgi:hypothetical protein